MLFDIQILEALILKPKLKKLKIETFRMEKRIACHRHHKFLLPRTAFSFNYFMVHT